MVGSKPGTLTALMGVTGAGKTLLDAGRSCHYWRGLGEMLIDGYVTIPSSERRDTCSNRICIWRLVLSVKLWYLALSRQPATISRQEKVAYVEVIHMLGMEERIRKYRGQVVGEAATWSSVSGWARCGTAA